MAELIKALRECTFVELGDVRRYAANDAVLSYYKGNFEAGREHEEVAELAVYHMQQLLL